MALNMCARHWLIARRDAARVEFECKKRAIQTRLRAPERPCARGARECACARTRDCSGPF